MNSDLLPAVLIGAPAALTVLFGTVVTVAEWRDRPRQRAVTRLLAESAAARAAAQYDLSGPPPPGAPTTAPSSDTTLLAPGAGGAQVIAFPARRAA